MAAKKQQSITATQEWRARMKAARSELPIGIGQQDVLLWITQENPGLDKLTNATRWRNAWLQRVADPEFTVLVEKSVPYFKAKYSDMRNCLARMRLKKVQ